MGVPTTLELVEKMKERVRRQVILSGRGSLLRGLDGALEKALERIGGGKVGRVDDPVFAGAAGGLALAADSDESDWEKLST